MVEKEEFFETGLSFIFQTFVVLRLLLLLDIQIEKRSGCRVENEWTQGDIKKAQWCPVGIPVLDTHLSQLVDLLYVLKKFDPFISIHIIRVYLE